MIRSVGSAAMCLMAVVATSPAGAADEEPPQRSFAASTAGAPVGLATGGWRDETNGAGRLEVDFASAPAPASTAFAATWVTAPVQLRQDAGPQLVGSVYAFDHIGNNATDTVMRMQVEYRTRPVGAVWSPWTVALSSDYTGPMRQPRFGYFPVQVRADSDCDCQHQAELRVSGSKSGLDVSRLTVITLNGGE